MVRVGVGFAPRRRGEEVSAAQLRNLSEPSVAMSSQASAPLLPRRGCCSGWLGPALVLGGSGLFAVANALGKAYERTGGTVGTLLVTRGVLSWLFNGLLARSGGEPLLNVATDLRLGCCRYYEPRRASLAAGHPYPFRPRTHLYRDTFGGFVDTVRGALRARTGR